jgi:predicted exporter
VRSYSSIAALFPSEATQAARRAPDRAPAGARAAVDLRAALEAAGFDPEPFAPFLAQLAHLPPPLELEEAAGGELDFLLRTHEHDDARERLVSTYVYPQAGGDGARAIAALQKYSPAAGGGVVTGAPILEEELLRIVERDTLKVTIASALAVALLLALYYRRARPWLAVMGPLALAWVLFAAALALLKLPLNLYNLLAVPLVIGYGIDDHVFLVHRHEADPSGGPGRTLSTTGRAVVLTSLSTMAGFAALAVARFDGLRLLGLSGALAVALCLLAAFAVLPALLMLLWPERPLQKL